MNSESLVMLDGALERYQEQFRRHYQSRINRSSKKLYYPWQDGSDFPVMSDEHVLPLHTHSILDEASFEEYLARAIEVFRTERASKSTLSSTRVLTFVIVGKRGSGTVVSELEAQLEYFDKSSQYSTLAFAVGFGTAKAGFTEEKSVAPINYFRKVSKWKYSGATDILIFDSVLKPLALDFSESISFTIEEVLDKKSIYLVGQLLEQLIDVGSQDHERPTWEFSNDVGRKLAGGGLWSSLLSLIPEALRRPFDQAKPFAVKDLSRFGK